MIELRPRPTGRQKIEIAERAAVALRSVDIYFDGSKGQRPNTVIHIERALTDLGYFDLIRIHDP